VGPIMSLGTRPGHCACPCQNSLTTARALIRKLLRGARGRRTEFHAHEALLSQREAPAGRPFCLELESLRTCLAPEVLSLDTGQHPSGQRHPCCRGSCRSLADGKKRFWAAPAAWPPSGSSAPPRNPARCRGRAPTSGTWKRQARGSARAKHSMEIVSCPAPSKCNRHALHPRIICMFLETARRGSATREAGRRAGRGRAITSSVVLRIAKAVSTLRQKYLFTLSHW